MRWRGDAVARVGLVLVAAGALPASVAAVRSGASGPYSAMVPTAPPAIPGRDTVAGPVRDARRTSALGHDPFRLTRAPSAVPYDHTAGMVSNTAPPPPPARPLLQLTGILWGSRPEALIEGIPGVEGARLLQVGDTEGGLRLRSLTSVRAVLTGFDTSWTLQIREPWK